MNSADNIKRFFKNASVSTNPKVDEAIVNQLIQVQEKAAKEKSAEPGINAWRIIMKSPITKLTAAAVIIVAAWLFFTTQKMTEQIEVSPKIQTSTSESLAELTLLISLNTAFQRGGIQAIEKQLAEADEKINLGSKEKLTIEQLLCELGHCDES